MPHNAAGGSLKLHTVLPTKTNQEEDSEAQFPHIPISSPRQPLRKSGQNWTAGGSKVIPLSRK